MQRVTGSRIDPEPYLEYLETKYQARSTGSVGLRNQGSGLRAGPTCSILAWICRPTPTPGLRLDKFLAAPDRLGSRGQGGDGARARQDLSERRRGEPRRRASRRLTSWRPRRALDGSTGQRDATPGAARGQFAASSTRTTRSSSSTNRGHAVGAARAPRRAPLRRTTTSRITSGRAASVAHSSSTASISTRPGS